MIRLTNWVDITNTSRNNIYQTSQNSERKTSLGKDDFLKILTTQLSHQDPTNPLQDRDFIAQMATFSSLEQITNLNTSFGKFVGMQMSQYSGAIGKEISWTPDGSTTVYSGVVDGVSAQDGSYFYTVGDEKVPMESVIRIKQANSEAK